ncbi:MAG: radical SAM protein, partial [Planctomycetota bacterium]|nr:radical SAM protein [Planctomycetota bacterium]
DREIPALLKAAADHGATSASFVLLRLPWQVKALFIDWLGRNFPDRAAHVLNLIRDSRNGELYDSSFHKRQRGEGAIAEQIAATFKLFARRHGLDGESEGLSSESFRPPKQVEGQYSLF